MRHSFVLAPTLIALAAAITGLITLAVAPTVALQLLLFGALALLATWGGRRWYAANPVLSADPLLNDRAGRLVGETIDLTRAMVNGRGFRPAG